MRTVIKGSDIDGFISQNRDIRGFVAKKTDAGTDVFANSDDMIEGLRLDYDGGFQGETSVGVIEWPNDATDTIDIPFGPGFSSAPLDTAPYPFVGNGFTSTTSGRLVSEYKAGNPIVPPEGAQLFELTPTGDKVLRAEFTGGAWVPR